MPLARVWFYPLLGDGVTACAQHGQRGLHLMVRLLAHWHWLRRLGEGHVRGWSWLPFQGLEMGLGFAPMFLFLLPLARMVVPMRVHWPTLGVGLGLTILARLQLEYCMPFWELRLCFVQRRVALLLAALSGVDSFGVVSHLPCAAGHDGAMLYACSIARLAATVHVHWPTLGIGLSLNIPACLWPECCISCITLPWSTSLPLWAGF
ncbi:hypothetical protein V6N12_049280 [Hibiscus sabdariffa]|uniref:Uncharacterized protein n=1 Tax=Hibiscus sabdariffa TaxID=183260 RepID=A0ABR2ELE4_9ROSI